MVPRTGNLKVSFAILRYILESAKELLSFDNSKWKQIQQRESLNSYIRLIKEGFLRESKLSKQRMEGLQREILDFTRRLQATYRKELEEKELYETLSCRDTSHLEAKAKDDFEKMGRMIDRGIYENINFSGGVCIARTGQCYVRHGTKRYFVGRFEIKIEKDKVEYINLDYSGNGAAHPHISSGNPCYGNIAADLAKILGKKEYLIALELIYRYLNSYNHSGAYVKVDHREWIWKEVDKDGNILKKSKKK